MSSPQVKLELWHGNVKHIFHVDTHESFSRAFHTTSSMYAHPVVYVYGADQTYVDQDDTPNTLDRTASVLVLQAVKDKAGYAKPSPVSVLINSSYIHNGPAAIRKRKPGLPRRSDMKYIKMSLKEATSILSKERRDE